MCLSNVFLYHQLQDGSFKLYYNTTLSYNTTQKEVSAFVTTDLNISVKKGDRIGVQVFQLESGICSFQPVASSDSNCLPQVLFNAENDVHNLQTINSVFLNVRASIGNPCTELFYACTASTKCGNVCVYSSTMCTNAKVCVCMYVMYMLCWLFLQNQRTHHLG